MLLEKLLNATFKVEQGEMEGECGVEGGQVFGIR